MKAPSLADLALIDPDGAFRDRLMRDHDSIVALSQQGALRELETVVHRLAGAAATFGYMESAPSRRSWTMPLFPRGKKALRRQTSPR
ncbi:MAG TPA: hypothetical protein VHA70_04250 [Bauldia sp.]|nr:hypothetical protein [Bauldia sp.]